MGITMKRKLALFTTIVLAFVALAGARAETANAQDNTAVAINLRDGASIFRFAFKIARVNQDVVDNTNAAAAVGSCVECETIAAAFQVVLVFSDPAVVSPENLALAINIECPACETLAFAYQWVLTTGGPVHFTAEGNQRIAEIKHALRDLLESADSMPIADLQAAMDALADELHEVVQTELVAAGGGDEPSSAGTPPEEEPTETPTETAPSETTPTETTETTTTETTTTSTP
jgi:putative peptide zinc metalloprotease protein